MKIKHGDGLETRYAHCSKILVKKGDIVERNQVIALVGNTGRSTGPHLHYEVHKNGKAVDPVYFYYNDLNEEEFEQMSIDAQNYAMSHLSWDVSVQTLVSQLRGEVSG